MSKKRIIVDISDAKISNDINDVLVTYSLGSCIGVCLYDRVGKSGAMLHYQLPESSMNPEKAQRYPFMFADTALNAVLGRLEQAGINAKRLSVKVAGGASMATGPQGFDIGKRNYMILRKILWKRGLLIESEDIGGNSPRNLYMDIESGMVTVRSIGLEKKL